MSSHVSTGTVREGIVSRIGITGGRPACPGDTGATTGPSPARLGADMADDKDRLGDRLREKERGEEDRFFAERDKAALEKLRRAKATAAPFVPRCPRDGEPLTTVDHYGVRADTCPKCHGM